MHASAPQLDRSLIAQLHHDLPGRVLRPGDEGYDAARALYFRSFDRRPAAIVRATETRDVARAVAWARAAGTPLAVRNGGHSPAGHGVPEGAIVLDVTGLRALEIDVRTRVARAGAGLSAGEYTRAAGEHGLATGFGDAPSVAVGGITLAGGVGFLHRRLGMTIDQLLGAEVVSADGEVRRADPEHEPDLFWGIRGGGGNLGVVTRLELRLHEVSEVVGGMLLLPASAERVVAFLDAAAAAPEALSMIMMVAPAPPLPMIPAEQHGRLLIIANLVYAGPAAAAASALAPFRALAAPVLDAVRPMRYPSIYDMEPPHPAAVAARTRFLDSLGLPRAERLLERLQSGTAPMRAVQFRPLGGAVARVPADATAYAHRARRFIVNVAAMYERAADADEHRAWATGTSEELGEAPAGAYVGFLGDDGAARIREAYPGETWSRLARLKHRYDPENLFRHNHNITPSADG